jgi:hypothetical protein
MRIVQSELSLIQRACRVVPRGNRLLVGLVGDGLRDNHYYGSFPN